MEIDFCNWESQDGTLELAKSLESTYPQVKVITQRDNGIYQAMNLGIANSNNSYIWFMNAGDCFYNASSLLTAVNAALKSNSDLVIGGHQIKGQEINRTYHFREKNISKFGFAFNRRYGCHQSMLFRTESLKDSGSYNLEFKICSDFDAVLKILQSGKARRIGTVLSRIEPGGGADKEILFVLKERQKVREQHLNSILVWLLGGIWTYLAILKHCLKTLTKKERRLPKL